MFPWKFSSVSLRHELHDVCQFVEQWLTPYSTDRILYVRLDTIVHGGVVSGYCRFPTKTMGYRLECHAPGPFPTSVEAFSSTTQRDKLHSEQLIFRNQKDAFVWIIAHECGHFLLHSKQIAKPNNEYNADVIAHTVFKRYRRIYR